MASTTKCPDCGSSKVWKKGLVPTKQGRKIRYVCWECGRSFYSGSGVAEPVKKRVAAKTRTAKATRAGKKKAGGK